MQPRTLSMSLVALVALAGPALADDVHCPPALGAVTIDGNVLVAAACRLDGTTVNGNVLLYSGGSLVARGARVVGNVQAERADFVDVERSRVDGDVQLDDLVGDLSRIERATVGGNVQLVGNRSRLEVLASTVDGDVQAFSNTGGVLVQDNRIGGNLQCQGNAPAPVGGDNIVQGNMEDQCANLQPEAGDGQVPGLGPTPPSSGTTSGSSGGGGSFGLLSAALAFLALAARRVSHRRGARARSR